MQQSVLDFVRAHAVLHSSMTYNTVRKSFVIKPCMDPTPGVYFILNNSDIVKIGKAEGRSGLKGRIQTYRGNLATRKNDHTVERIYTVMTGILEGCTLGMYILPLPTQTIDFKGYQIELQMARSLELTLSKRARAEGHSMLLSGQD